MLTLALSAAFTLAFLAALAILARRARGALRGRLDARSLEVIDRVSIGPKQGLSAVRVRDRVVLVSTGDGGVRSVLEMSVADWTEQTPEDDRGSDTTSTPARTMRLPAAVNGAQRRMVAPRLRRFLTVLTLAAVGLGNAPLHAVVAPVPVQAEQEAAEDGGSAFLQALPSITETTEEDAPLELSGPIGTALLLGVMALLPTLLLLATGFTRILIVLHLLKQALGAQAVPPTHLINALALLLTLFLMGPTLDRASTEAIDPWLDGEITQVQMFERVSEPFRDFMLEYASEEDLARFVDLRGEEIPNSAEDVSFLTLMAAFTTSELKRAFQLGFALFLPFIIIDLVVASVLMSMGMFMLPPVMISLPFKLLLFVLADGWRLVVSGLLGSF